MDVVTYVLIVLAIVTVVGHGIWVLLAKLIAAASAKPAKPCPICSALISPLDRSCKYCGWSPIVLSWNRVTSLKWLRRVIAQFEARAKLDRETCEAFSTVLDAQQRRWETQRMEAVAPEVVPHVAEEPSTATEPTAAADLAEATLVAEPSADSFDERVERFKQSRAAEPTVQPPPVPVKTPRPARSWIEVLATFMERRHIRWGELVGGLLIVFCSTALVISFWADIAQRPFLKFFVFNGVTAALFGLGLYAHRRWKLETTSHGVLIIAALLVPLNFLAIAAFSMGQTPLNFITLGGEIFSVVLFATLLLFTARVLLPEAPVLMMATVIVPSIFTLVIRRHVNPELSRGAVVGIAASLALVYAALNQWLLWKNRQIAELESDAPITLLKLLGLSTFAVALPLALLIHRGGEYQATLQHIAPLLSVVGLPALVLGLWFWRRVALPGEGGLRTIGTSAGVFGTIIMMAGIAFAWPHPQHMLPAAACNFLVLIAVALMYALPPVHLLSSLCLAISVLLGWLLMRGDIQWTMTADRMLASLTSADSAVAMTGVAVLLCTLAAALSRLVDRLHALWHLPTIAGLSIVSLALVTGQGFGRVDDTSGAVWLYSFHGVAAMAIAARFRRTAFAWLGAWLLLAASVQGIVFTYGRQLPFADHWIAAMVLHALVMTIIVTLSSLGKRPSSRVLLFPCTAPALVSSVLATGWLVLRGPLGLPLLSLQALGVLSLVWMILAVVWRQRPLAAAAQVALTAAVLFGVASVLREQPWVFDQRSLWCDPRSVQIYGLALVTLAGLWGSFRWALRRNLDEVAESSGAPKRLPVIRAILHPLIHSSHLTLDRCLLVLALALLIGLVSYGAAPGALVELSPAAVTPEGRVVRALPALRQFEIEGLPHAAAFGAGSWLLLGSLVVIFAARLKSRLALGNLYGLLIALAACVPLLAGPFESQAAVASAMRWLSAGYLLLTSLAIWLRQLWMPRWKLSPNLSTGARAQLRPATIAGLFVLAFVPIILMFGYVALSAVVHSPPSDDLQSLWAMVATLFVAVGFCAILFWQTVERQRIALDIGVARLTGIVLLILAAAPLVSVSLFVLASALQQRPINGPDPSAIFAQMGTAASYAVPIFVTAWVVVGYALRERSQAFAFAGALLLCVASSAAYLLSLARAGQEFDASQWVRLAQLDSAVLATYGISWMAILWLDAKRRGAGLLQRWQSASTGLLTAVIALSLALHALVLGAGSMALFRYPVPGEMHGAIGDWVGWITLALALAGGVLYVGHRMPATTPARRRSIVLPICGMLLVIGLMLVCTTTFWDRGTWLSYHVLMIVASLCSLAAPCLAYLEFRRTAPEGRFLLPREVTQWSTLLGVFTIALALRALPGDPQSPWWTVAAIVATATLAVVLACGALRRGYLYLAAALVNMAAMFTWLELNADQSFIPFVQMNLLALCLPVPLWVFVERRFFAAELMAMRRQPMSLDALASWSSVVALATTASFGLTADFHQRPLATTTAFAWLAVAGAFVAMLACLWNARMRTTVAGVYCLGLVLCAMTVDAFDLPAQWLVWTGSITVAAYCLATSYLWSCREGLVNLAARCGIPISDRWLTSQRWIVPANGLLVGAVVVLGFATQLIMSQQSLRILSAQAILAQALAVGLLARGERRTPLQYAALWVGALGAVAFGWSWVELTEEHRWLHYTIQSLAALVTVMAVYGLGLSKLMRRQNEWTRAAERLVPVLAGFAIAAVVVILGSEFESMRAGRAVALGATQILIVAVSLAAITFSCLASALIPGRDPFGLSERQRTVYVYVAEAMLAMFFLHVRLSMPWLFTGWFTQFWPIAVMLIAFIGVALSEIFRRQRRIVLAEPLERTGAFLPLLPVVGFWFVPSALHYSVLMLAAGGVYLALATLRRSFMFGVLGALAANGGLWYFLHHTGTTALWQHPQLWLIPPALCVLAGAYLNRDRLSEAQLGSLRYSAAAAIYVSSTADIFLNGVANAPWLPLVLGGLSLVGIFCGILLRVRGILFLGTAFLLLALFTIIWYAAVDLRQTWIWAVTGIVTGILIIAVFAVFEKKRQEVLKLLEQLKEWRP